MASSILAEMSCSILSTTITLRRNCLRHSEPLAIPPWHETTHLFDKPPGNLLDTGHIKRGTPPQQTYSGMLRLCMPLQWHAILLLFARHCIELGLTSIQRNGVPGKKRFQEGSNLFGGRRVQARAERQEWSLWVLLSKLINNKSRFAF